MKIDPLTVWQEPTVKHEDDVVHPMKNSTRERVLHPLDSSTGHTPPVRIWVRTVLSNSSSVTGSKP